MSITSVMIVGVGGQGTLLASQILGRIFTRQGFDVKVSEVHGMSQRGGSVVTYVRWGEKVYSPVIEIGGADLILSFEQLEAARWLPYLKQGGQLITNTQKIDPMPVVIGAAQYPTDILDKLAAKGAVLTAVDALSLAEQAGNAKAVNVVLLGVTARKLGLDQSDCLEAIRAIVPAKLLAINEMAFALGYAQAV